MNNKEKKIIYLIFGGGLQQGASLLGFVVLARVLGSEEFGVWRQLFLVQQIAVAIFYVSVPTSLMYFAGRAEKDNRSSVAGVHVAWIILMSLICYVVLLVGSTIFDEMESIHEFAKSLRVFSIGIAALMVGSICVPVLVLFDQERKSLIYSAGLALLNLVVVFMAAILDWGVGQLVYASVTSSIVGGAIGFGLIRRKIKITRVCKSEFKEILKYTAPLMLAAGVALVGLRLDHILVSTVLGAVIYGIYAVGAFEIPIFSMLQSSITTVLMPKFSRLASERRWSDVERVWNAALIKSAYVVYPVSAALAVVAEEFVGIFFGAEYIAAAKIFAIYMLMAPLRVISFGLLLRASGRSREDLIASIVYFLMSLVFVSTGIVFYGVVGAVGGVVLATFGVAAWSVARTSKLTDGYIGFRNIYPIKVAMWFPFLVVVFSGLKVFLIHEVGLTSNILILAVFGGIAFALSSSGYQRSKQMLLE